MGLNDGTASSAVRVSLGPETTENDVMRFAEMWLTKREKRRARVA
jgi:cysteine desulfurase